MDLLIEFAKIGLGIGCVIRELVQKELDSGLLVELPLKPPIPRRTIGFAYHPANQAMALKTFSGVFVLSICRFICSVSIIKMGCRPTAHPLHSF